jgi:tetratricopeptide (TPR) repeat protein
MTVTTPLDLTKVDFAAGLAELRARARSESAADRLRLAECLSLSAITGPYAPALARVAEARRLDPQNPRHLLREALTHLRFGAATRAVATLESLPEPMRHGEDVAILRALAALQEGELKRAKNIASDLADAQPTRHPAKFLALDAQMRVALKGTERRLTELPREPGTEAPWADLLVKLALLRPDDTRAITQQLDARKVLPKEGAAREAVDDMLSLAALDLPALFAKIREAAPGSRLEELLLVRASACLSAKPRREALEAMRALHDELPDRASVRRVWALMLTQHAVDEATASRFQEALAAVEVCIRLEPHQRMHQQNRAALFTLMSDRDAAEQAWFELERHHYRLALSGAFDPETLVRPHRMVAQQARISPGLPPRGVFKLDALPGAPSAAGRHLVVDQAYVDRDPERLRQWIHHRAAELVLSHAALGPKALLEPLDAEEARERVEALRELGSSLRVLVPVEGERLADSLHVAFTRLASGVRHRYAKPALDDAQKDLVRAHVETLGDAALLCLTFNPDAERRGPIDDILRLTRAVAPFFDAELMTSMLRKGTPETPDALPRLEGVLRRLLRIEAVDLTVTRAGRRQLRGFLTAQLEVAWVAARLAARPKPSHAETEQLLAILERAAGEAPDDPIVLYWRARVALMGSLLDDVPGYIAAFHRAVRGEHHPLLERVEELEDILAKYKTAGVETRHAVLSKVGDAGEDASGRTARERSESDLVAELDRQPTAIRLYEQLLRRLLVERRFTEAETWADRAVARCLSAVTQRKARTLHLEVLGLAQLSKQSLGAIGDDAIRTYASGSRVGAMTALAKIEAGAGGYALEFVRGQALLAASKRQEAQQAFRRALAGCDRGIHMVILRPLAASVDAVLVERLEATVEPLVASGDHAAALEQVTRAMREMDEPEHALSLLASVQHAAALQALEGAKKGGKPVLVDPGSLPPALAERLALTPKDDTSVRARKIAELAITLSPTTAGLARSILRRLERVESQVALATTLERCHAATEAGKLDEALALLEGLPKDAHGDPRVVRQSALLFLRLGRFDDAERSIARLEGSEHPIASELRERWPAIRFKHRLAAAQRALRASDLETAQRLLSGTTPSGDDEALSLAYVIGFHGALLAEARQKEDRLDDAQHALAAALDALDGLRPKARERGRKDLLDLFEQLESRAALVERARKGAR